MPVVDPTFSLEADSHPRRVEYYGDQAKFYRKQAKDLMDRVNEYAPISIDDLQELAILFTNKYKDEDHPIVQKLIEKFTAPVEKALGESTKDES